MKKLEKEAVLKERMILISAVSFFIFILPYIVHLGINGIQPVDANEFGKIEQTISVEMSGRRESIQLETYLVGALARNSDPAYEDQTLKAIVVILRSNAVCAIVDGEPVQRDSFYTDEELRILWGKEYEANIQRYRDVVTATEGIVLFYDGDIVEVPFHRLSAGVTRDSEIWTKEVPYVHAVESAEDMYADDYYMSMEVSGDLLGPDFKILNYDRSGYVLSVQIKGKIVQGEVFSSEYGFPSSCFDYDCKEGMYIFYIRGSGHGFGLSTYGANVLAIKGWSFAEILQYFYPGIEIRKENRSDVWV